jgi:acetyl esterase/lipase
MSFDVDALLDPEIATAIATLPVNAALSNGVLPAMRANMRTVARSFELTDQVTRTDHEIESTDGFCFTIRVHRGVGAPDGQPIIVWLHGGGMVAGTHLIDDIRFDKWCAALGVVGVAVDYGLAPERPYPGPLEDCYAALRWARDHAAEIGGDAGRIGIGGNSAGGGLAAGLALLARDRGEVAVSFAALVYPMIDDRMTTASSGWDVPIWPPASNDFGWSAYLAGVGWRGAGDVPVYAAPARATDLAGLPPTFISVGALDGFLDEDVDYAGRLLRAGVPTELHVYPGAPHGFDLMMPGTQIARRARRHLDEWIAAQVAR